MFKCLILEQRLFLQLMAATSPSILTLGSYMKFRSREISWEIQSCTVYCQTLSQINLPHIKQKSSKIEQKCWLKLLHVYSLSKSNNLKTLQAKKNISLIDCGFLVLKLIISLNVSTVHASSGWYVSLYFPLSPYVLTALTASLVTHVSRFYLI